METPTLAKVTLLVPSVRDATRWYCTHIGCREESMRLVTPAQRFEDAEAGRLSLHMSEVSVVGTPTRIVFAEYLDPGHTCEHLLPYRTGVAALTFFVDDIVSAHARLGDAGMQVPPKLPTAKHQHYPDARWFRGFCPSRLILDIVCLASSAYSAHNRQISAACSEQSSTITLPAITLQAQLHGHTHSTARHALINGSASDPARQRHGSVDHV